MNKQDNIAINNLKEYFEKNEDVVMAFIFGSRAKENIRLSSDWDIAVYFTPQKGYLEWEEQDREYLIEDRVWSDCVETLKTDDVDLIVLNRIAASIAATAIQGMPLVIKDYDLWLKFLLIITQEAEDYREFVDDYYAISQRSASLTPQDRESLKKTISFLEEQMSIYSYFNDFSERDYTNDIHKRNDVERWIENIVNSSLDLSKIILASQKKIIPDTYSDSIKQAIWFLELPQDFVERFQRWVKLRNILAHEYLDIKWKRISDFIQNSQEYFQALLEAAKGYLANSGEI
ncbi:MAG: HepT-like ribonuclease domain-containing protein [Planctomycetota bacterium]